MTSAYGLPWTVTNLLKHMEPYKDLLKWNISGSTTKITLHLSWNFSKQCQDDGLWNKLQRILKIKGGDGIIPENISRILNSSPKTKSSPKLKRSQSYRSALGTPKGGPRRVNSLGHVQRSASSTGWPSPPSFRETRSPDREVASQESSTNVSLNDSIRSNRVKLVYQSEEEVEKKMQEKVEKVQERTKEELKSIRHDWNKTVKNWDDLIKEESTLGASVSDNSGSLESLRNTKDTVAKCFESCDKILERHSTLIL